MSLRVRLPLDGNLENKGLDLISVTNSGATINTAGKVGQCYSFDGTDDYISLSGLGNIFKGGSNPFSMSFWFYHTGNSRRGVIFGNYGLISSNRFNVELTAANVLRFWWDGSPDWTISTFTIPTQTWIHCTIVYDGSAVRIYKDGVLNATRSGALTAKTPTGNYYLGRDSRTGATAFYGKLNEFQVYDHALSIHEIKDIYRTLILHYKLDDPYLNIGTNLISSINPVNPVAEYENGVVVHTVSDPSLFVDIQYYLSTSLTGSQPYTISFLAKSSNGSTLPQVILGTTGVMEQIDIIDGYNVLTFTPNQNGANVINLMFTGADYTADFYVTNMKVESGSTATPYGDSLPKQVYDCSGYGRDAATLQGTVSTSSSGQPRYSKCFTTSQSGIMSKDFYIPAVCTYCWWANVPNGTAKFFIDARKNNTGVQPAYQSGTTFQVYSTNGGSNNHSISISYNTWHHFAVVLTESGNTVFMDGVQVATGTTAKGVNSLSYVTVGMRHSSTYLYTGMKINDVRLYATALTVDDVKEIMTQASLDNKGNFFCYELVEDDSIKIRKNGIVNAESFNEETLTGKQASMLKTGTFKVNQEFIEK